MARTFRLSVDSKRGRIFWDWYGSEEEALRDFTACTLRTGYLEQVGVQDGMPARELDKARPETLRVGGR